MPHDSQFNFSLMLTTFLARLCFGLALKCAEAVN
jgi:hypothetical protein